MVMPAVRGLAKLLLTYEGGEALGKIKPGMDNMLKNKQQMDLANLIGGDNFYHRKAMIEAGQSGLADALIALGGGVLKEGKDLFCKTTGKCDKKMLFSEAWDDSVKDMGNNWEGIILGLKNKNKPARFLLEDLDLKTNEWKKNDKD